ncbi:hypothetical protein [Flavobacterium sp. KACC 22761]|uniref:hypothetical protein n=1 Tax=Flavobacterium sp. KACC 22761 TaxID=3092665 RepID=UPI002A75DC40|nr:hypothetical protein [Flavobacterium sp. KACC 22761]WPO78722.1 hypothetical protein SCB73_20930 [Flavobacterium sp. KACC 22761]
MSFTFLAFLSLDLFLAFSSVVATSVEVSSFTADTGSIAAGFTTGVNTFFAGVLRTAGFTVAVGAAVFAAGFAGAFVAVVLVAADLAVVAGFAVVEAAGLAVVVVFGAAGLRTGAFAAVVFAGFSATGFVVSVAGESIFSGVISSGLFSI